MSVLFSSESPSGLIEIVETSGLRKLTANGFLLGASYLKPSSTDIFPSALNGPGPIPQTSYQLAWLLAARRFPYGKGLMAGLGSGSGAVSLLYHFTRLSLDVVEIDSAMASIAREYFPLTLMFEKTGQMKIVHADVFEFLDSVKNPYDFVLFDIVSRNDKNPDEIKQHSFAEKITKAGREVWVNVICSRESLFLLGLLNAFKKAGRPVRHLFSPTPFDHWLPLRRNWILTTADVDPIDCNLFVPFQGLNGKSQKNCKEDFKTLLGNHLAGSEIE